MTPTVQLGLPDLLALVERANLAPSPRNVQPWRWTVRDGGAELELAYDGERALPVSDPGGREAVMACGAALMTFRVAAAREQLGVDVEPLPDPAHPDVLATIRLADHPVDAEFAVLDAAVPVRRTWHGPMRAEPVPAPLRDRLAAEAHAEGARLVEIPAGARDAVARLVAGADAERGLDGRWRAEQARWVRPRWRRDGVPASVATVVPARLAVRYLDLGGYVGAQDAALVRAAPMLAVLATPGEDRASWLAAGQALQRVLLVAAEHGLATGFANSVCEDPARRTALAAMLGGGLHPQAVLRLGRRPGAAGRRSRAVAADAAARLTRRATRRRRPVADSVDVVGAVPDRSPGGDDDTLG